MNDKQTKVDELINIFATEEIFDKRREVLIELIKFRALHQLRDDSRLDSGISYLSSLALNTSNKENCLEAVADLARIGTVKSLSDRVAVALLEILKNPLPQLLYLNEADDKYYVAKALHVSNESWIEEYVAKSIVEEKQAEKARKELVSILFAKIPTLQNIFELIEPHLKLLKPETKNPGDSVAKRIERIISAIRPLAVSSLIEPGESIGEQLYKMIRVAFFGAKAPETDEVANKATNEIAGLVHDIARTQISLVAEPSLYSAIDVPKSWYEPPLWRYFAENSFNLNMVARDIREALTLLAKQGTTDDQLFEQLIKTSGSREAAVLVTSEIALQHPGLDAEIVEWLKSGGVQKRKKSLGGMEDSNKLSADPLLATLLIDSHKFSEALSDISEDDLVELRMLEPELSKPIEKSLIRGRSIVNNIAVLSNKRDLHIYGSLGDIAEYSPQIHELVGGHRQGVRKVKIVQPMIIRGNVPSSDSIIRKAIVEQVEL